LYTPPRCNIYDVRKVSSVDQAVIDLAEGVSIWGVPGLEVDSFVHEVRTFDRNLPACGKVDQSEAIFICTLMQALFAYRWLMNGFPANFCVRVSHHQLHIMTWAFFYTLLLIQQIFHSILDNLNRQRIPRGISSNNIVPHMIFLL
jgi:hypothetical protein